jgi:uncharacterized repeat protein (TIGR03803 family)
MTNITRPTFGFPTFKSAAIPAATLLAPFVTLVLALSVTATAQTFTLLRQFRSGAGGINPEAGLILDAKGNLYGTTYNDGSSAVGTVFEISPTGRERVLHSFTGVTGDGAFPLYGALVRDSSGILYGTTSSGGIYDQSCLFGCGTVFKVDPFGEETILYSFTNANGGSSQPWFGLVRDSAGNLYGTTLFGGTLGSGTVYKIGPAGDEIVLYNFQNSSSDGGIPEGNLILDAKGNLYGTTESGGASFNGTVFEVAPNGTETVLYNFTGQADGGGPAAGLVRDSAGNFYGTAQYGGASGVGTIFKITLQGKETTLHSFTGGAADGADPFGGSLVRDSSGNLYGVTQSGGPSDFGVVFKLDPSGTETILHSFSGPDGKLPYGTLALDRSGNLYGTTYQGGAYGGGGVFKITP